MFLQDYSYQKKIDGVKIFTPRKFKDDGGSFLEIFRMDEDGFWVNMDADHDHQIKIQQVNHSRIHPGVIKAWHFHEYQTDVWYLLDKAIVGLIDGREDSPTFNMVMRLVLENQVLVIPPGLYHGIANPYYSDVNLIYFVNKEFEPTDEFREDYRYKVGEEFWQIVKG